MSCPGDNYVVPGANPCGGGGGGGGDVNSVSGGTGILISGTVADPIVNCTIIQTPRPTDIIFVSKSGNNVTADGSMTLPFLTIQAAINFRSSLPILNNVIIFILSSGTFSENLTINYGNTFINSWPSQNDFKTVVLAGSISVNVTQPSGLTGVEVGFQNIQTLTGTITTSNTVLTEYLLMMFSDCVFNSGFICNTQTTQQNLVEFIRCNFTNSLVLANTIQNNGCAMKVLRCDFDNSSSTYSSLDIGGIAGSLNLQFTTISMNSVNAYQPAIYYDNTGASTGNITANNIIRFRVDGLDTTVGKNKCCIQYKQTGTVVDAFVGGNQFICPGANYGAPSAMCIQRRGTGAVTITALGINGGCNGAGANPSSYTIDPSIIKTYTGALAA